MKKIHMCFLIEVPDNAPGHEVEQIIVLAGTKELRRLYLARCYVLPASSPEAIELLDKARKARAT